MKWQPHGPGVDVWLLGEHTTVPLEYDRVNASLTIEQKKEATLAYGYGGTAKEVVDKLTWKCVQEASQQRAGTASQETCEHGHG